MADVNRVQGPSGPTDPLGQRKEKQVPESFKERMRQVEKVEETDPEQKGKQKRYQVPEEERPMSSKPIPPDHVPPFSLERQKPAPSPLAPERPPDRSRTPSPTEQQAKPTREPLPKQEPLPKKESLRTQAEPVTVSKKKKKPPVKEAEKPPTKPSEPAPSGKEALPSLTPQPPKDIHETFFTQQRAPGKKADIPESPARKPTSAEEEQKEAEEATQELPATPLGAPARHPTGEEKERRPDQQEEQLSLNLPLSAPPTPLPFPQIAQTDATPPSYLELPPQLLDVYEHIVGVLTVMTYSGVSETTVTLNAPQFGSSVFYGSQIIIREYSTAPKAFNIELQGAPEAVALFQGEIATLMNAFEKNTKFLVHRIEAKIIERPKIVRVEGIDRDKDKRQA